MKVHLQEFNNIQHLNIDSIYFRKNNKLFEFRQNET